MRISDWSSDVCSSDLRSNRLPPRVQVAPQQRRGLAGGNAIGLAREARDEGTRTMRHGFYGRRFNRSVSHRKAMFANMAAALVKHEQIKTTLPTAKDLRRVIDRLITLGKRGALHARRQALSVLRDTQITAKLLDRKSGRESGTAHV